MDKYRPCPSIIAMFTSDSQHPPRSRHAVYLGGLDTIDFASGNYQTDGFLSNPPIIVLSSPPHNLFYLTIFYLNYE